MKKLSVVLIVVLSLCLMASIAFADHHMKKGVVKSVDEKAGTVVMTIDGNDVTLKVDKGADLKDVKVGKKATATMDGDVVKSIKTDKPKAVVGC